VIGFRCRNCGKQGVPVLGRVLVRKGRNVSCSECGARYNYSWRWGLLANFVAATLGTALFYLIFFVGIGLAMFLWAFSLISIGTLVMILIPLRKVG